MLLDTRRVLMVAPVETGEMEETLAWAGMVRLVDQSI